MSRVGKAPIIVDDKVQVTVSPANEVTLKGGKSSLSFKLRPEVSAKMDGKKLVLVRNGETKQARSLHGLSHRRFAEPH